MQMSPTQILYVQSGGGRLMRDLPSKSHSNRQAPKKSLETPLLQCLKITKHFFFILFIGFLNMFASIL